ncbi:MAG: hypothetical protein ACXQS8_03400, partial [Candidatus Helarchaeales archaeon]
ITVLFPFFIKLHLKRHPQPRGPLFDYSKGILIVMMGCFLFFGNPLMWIVIGSTISSQLFSSINILVFLVMVYVMFISIVIVFLGFAMAYNRLGAQGMFICGALLGDAYLLLAFGFFFGDIYMGRILQIIFAFNGFLLGLLIVGIWRSLEKKRHFFAIKILTLSLIIGTMLPLTLLTSRSFYPNLEPNTSAEYGMMQWIANQPTLDYCYVADFRLEYLIKGTAWNPTSDLNVIRLLNIDGEEVVPIGSRYYEDLREAANISYPNQKLLLPIVMSYFTIGLLFDYVFPQQQLTGDDLSFFNNQTTCNKIYDNLQNSLYIIDLSS